MRQLWMLLSCLGGLWFPLTVVADDAPPRSLDSRIKIELFAEEPQLVTPTGIDVDQRGRVWVIESNTHFPPEGYKGHASDRVLVMSDTDGDGKADRIVVFTDNLKHAMSIALRPLWFPPESGGRQPPEPAPERKRTEPPIREQTDSSEEQPSRQESGVGSNAVLQGAHAPRSPVYVATRREIVLFHDDDGDDKADRQEPIVHLETKGTYPHNGLAGITFDAIGWMYFGFGENEGAEYKIIGSDGTTLSGGGEGGSLYRCRLDGTKLERWATGFWNPFASCFDAFGRMFTVDNDADSRPPCRLLHIIRDGDYGFRYRNGRKGLHPFTSWNGEIPGTLPMVAGTGEAPSGILAYESDGLPEEYIGNLLVTSWGDHRIDRFRLKPKGASFESLAEPFIVGGENFRPVGIACASDGSLYVSDWVLRDYKVHGKGRIWRISLTDAIRPNAVVNTTSMEVDKLGSRSIVQRRIAAGSLQSTQEGRAKLLSFLRDKDNGVRSRIEAAWAYARGLQSFDEFWSARTEPTDPARVRAKLELPDLALIEAAIDLLQIRNDEKARDLGNFLGLQAIFAFGNEDSVLEAESDRVWISFWDPEFTLMRLGETRHFAPQLFKKLNSVFGTEDPFVFSSLVACLGLRATAEHLLEFADNEEMTSANAFAGLLLAMKIRNPRARSFVERGLSNRSNVVKRISVQWVAEEKLDDLRPQVEAILKDPTITADLFLATLAALEMLDGVPPAQFDKTPPGKYVLPLVEDENRPASVRALALRMVDPNDPALADPLLSKLIASSDEPLRVEALRTLLACTVKRPLSPYARLISDDDVPIQVRAEAIAGLARPGKQGKLAGHTRAMLVDLLNGQSPILKREAIRALRPFVAEDPEVRGPIEKLANGKGSPPAWIKGEATFALNNAASSRPPSAGDELRAALTGPVRDDDDAAAGRRAFYRQNGAGCFQCHTVNGRGGRIGPDLSTIGRALSRDKLIDSILAPSSEIAPQFVTWSFETTAGKVHTGMLVFENEGKTTIGDTEGKLTELKTLDIVSRIPQKTSVMPEKLAERMSLQEFRDLLAFLEGLQ